MQISFIKRKVHFLYVTLAVVGILLAGVSYVRAETVAPGAPEVRTEAVGKALKARATGLTDEQKNRFINLVRNVSSRMEGAITRLEGIIVRIESKMVELEATGVDISQVRPPLSDAKNKLAEAKSQLAQAKADGETSLISDTPRERFKAARLKFSDIKQSIRDAYIFTRQALSELKDAALEAKMNKNGMASVAAASTTPSN